MEYSIVIPTYQEADKITSSLTKIVGFMRDFSKSFEIVVVDDGSKDNTADIVEEYIKSNPEIKLIRNPHKGKSQTVIAGMRNAAADLIYMCDADLSTPIEELKKLSLWIKEHDYDIVIGSREGAGARRIGEPYYRHLMGRIFNWYIQVMAVPGVTDSQCGFKLFKAEVIKEIISKLVVYKETPEEIEQAFWGAFDVEILFIARKAGYRIKELPVTWHYIEHVGRSLFSNSIKMAWDVLKIRLNSFKGAYK